jgi:hypothetical protein
VLAENLRGCQQIEQAGQLRKMTTTWIEVAQSIQVSFSLQFFGRETLSNGFWAS